MPVRSPLWVWHLLAIACLLAAGVLVGVYGWLPGDGASGDLESLTPEGFLVRRVIEPRRGGLHVGDVIVRAGGRTAEEWLAGAAPGDEWRSGRTVPYVVRRGGQELIVDVPLATIRPTALLARWGLQYAVALAFLGTGLYVVYRRREDVAARVLMIFCVLIAVQYVGDAYNIQFSTLPQGWPFWMHLGFEHTIYGLTLATMTCFALLFPAPHPAMSRHPALVWAGLVGTFALATAGSMALAPSWTAAVRWSSHASWVVAGIDLAIAFAAGARSVRLAADPVSRAQVRWIMWSGALGTAILVPGYVLPLILVGQPSIAHPVAVLVTALIPFTLAIAILRFRLFDIQVVTNRTLVYALITALLAGLYVLLVRTFTLIAEVLWRGDQTSLVIFAATLVVVLAVEPTRRRLQRLVDRVFFRNKLDYQQLLPEMSQRLARHLAIDQVGALLAGEVVERLQIAQAELDILDADGVGFERVPVARGGAGTPGVEPPPADHPLASYLRRTDRPLLRFQPPANGPAQAVDYLAARGAALAVPLGVGQKLVGIYYLGLKRSGDGYTGEEVNLLRLLGRQAAVAVENARLFAATERQAEELAGLHQAAVALSSTLVAHEVLHTLAAHLGRTLRVSHAHVWRLDGDGTAEVIALWRDEEVEAARGTPRLWPSLLCTLLEQEVVILQAPGAGLDDAARACAAEEGWQALLAVPLVVHGQVIGCAELWETRRPRTFGAREVQISLTMAADAAAAIDRAHLFEAERRQRRLTEALQQAADLVSGTLDLDQVLDRILDQVAAVVQGDASNLMLVDETRGERLACVVRRRGYTALGCDGLMSTLSLRVEDYPALSWMARTGRSTVIPDTATSRYWHVIPGMEWQHARVSAPIRVAGETIGFLNVDGCTPGAFGRDDARQLEVFGHHVATAIQNARLYEQAQVELAERRRAEERLKASLTEKEALLKEVHHRVKNNLQVISSLLYFQARAVTDPAVLTMLQETQLRVRSMALVHERLYSTTDLTRVDAADYVRTVAGYLFRAYGARDAADVGAGPIRFRIETEDVVLGVDEAMPCGLLLHELISNALKHAFPGGRSGDVCVSLHTLPDGDVCLSVADNGVGLPPGLEFESGETAATSPSGLGLRLIQHLVQQIDGVVEVHSDPIAGGTHFDVIFAGRQTDEVREGQDVDLGSSNHIAARQPVRRESRPSSRRHADGRME